MYNLDPLIVNLPFDLASHSRIRTTTTTFILSGSSAKGPFQPDIWYNGSQAKMLAAHHAVQQPKLTSKSKGTTLKCYDHLYGEGTMVKPKGNDRYVSCQKIVVIVVNNEFQP